MTRGEAYILSLKERRQKLRSSQKCIDCGKELPTPNYVRCEQCRSMDNIRCKQRYLFYKSHGICIRCGKNDAREGCVLCEECTLKKKQKYRQKVYSHYGVNSECLLIQK